MDRRWLAFLPGVLILLMPSLLLWPLPLAGGEAMIAAPWSEGASHLWGYWAAQQAGQFEFHSDLLSFPQGQDVVLIDPLHLLPFALGSAIGGPALGYNFVLCFGLMVSGLAGYLLARVTGASPEARVLGTCIGLSIPGLLAIGVDGITEGMGVGWVGIQLAVLLHLLRSPGPVGVVLLGLAGGACAWSGAYNAVWMALVDIPVLIGAWRKRGEGTSLRSALFGVGLAALLSVPYLLSAGQLSGDRPGASARAEPTLPSPDLPWRGSWREGADVLDLFVPGVLTPDTAGAPTTAYLGIVLLFALILGARRWEGARPWLLGGLAMSLLALGPWWVIGGRTVEFSGWPLPAPAGLLEEVPLLDRISRWYRAGSVAVLLLIPVAVRALPGRRILLLAPLVLLDGRFGGPIPPTLYRLPLPAAQPLQDLQGPVAELPMDHPIFPPEHPSFSADRVAGLNLLYQLRHGLRSSASLNQLPRDPDVTGALRALESQLMSPRPNPHLALSAQRQLQQAGYRSLMVIPDAMHQSPTNLSTLLGEPVARGEGWQVFSLTESSLDHSLETGQ